MHFKISDETTVALTRFARIDIEKSRHRHDGSGQALFHIIGRVAMERTPADDDPQAVVLHRGTDAECRTRKAELDRMLKAKALEKRQASGG